MNHWLISFSKINKNENPKRNCYFFFKKFVTWKIWLEQFFFSISCHFVYKVCWDFFFSFAPTVQTSLIKQSVHTCQMLLSIVCARNGNSTFEDDHQHQHQFDWCFYTFGILNVFKKASLRTWGMYEQFSCVLFP